MIKMVASDLDGTLLLNGAQKLPEDLIRLIRALKEKGILFCCSQRKTVSEYETAF
jgi:hydroxymethylpyrimidine pyrophosphatase-like HAD family hydrolase